MKSATSFFMVLLGLGLTAVAAPEPGSDAERLFLRQEARTARLAADLDRLAGSAPESAAVKRAREDWEERRRAALDFIFDLERFPDATNAQRISLGWEKARHLGEESSEALWSRERALDLELAGLRNLKPEEAAALRAEYEAAVEELRRLAATAGREPELPPVRDLAWLLLDVAERSYDEAARRFAGFEPGPERLRAFWAYARAILDDNAPVHPPSRDGAEGMLAMNRYRIGVGHSPLALNPKLMRAAGDHSAEMKRLHYFSHDSPIREHRTENDRAELAGYEAFVSENIYAAPSFPAAIGRWMKSGKHHRMMLAPHLPEAGYGTTGPCTVLFGHGETGAPPVLVY